MVGPGRPVIVLFGSSIVQQSFNVGGWGSILADLYDRKADVVLRGYSGWNSRRALEVLEKVFPKDHAAFQPSLIIVYFGGNDATAPYSNVSLGPHVPLHEYKENMKKIYTYLKSLSDKTRLIFLTTPPVSDEMLVNLYGESALVGYQARTNERVRQYAEALELVGKEMKFKVVNLWKLIQQNPNWEKTCFRDGIHFTAEGSRITAMEIVKAIKEASDWEPSLHWVTMAPEFSEDSPYYFVGPGDQPINFSYEISDWKADFNLATAIIRSKL